ncbi:hypothetical protein [Winogradskyella psychrotolerans]|uniref:hypothetical protein n=1 Tax=Winogradskyella psychrotolerans TaxID=1344585 RepID=UPI001C077F35|nr:hypothetical protein [Winogradskyella psychrotolerans]MBU2930077.1 hypothetical protein [Winogradskyella psychrotolerans]
MATWLIFIGNLLVVLTYIASLFISVFSGSENFDTIILAQSIWGIIQNLSYLIFAIGLIILTSSEFSKNKISK